MAKKEIQISIPQPCNEGWENMLPEEKGRFCLTCQKSLIDFSKLSDEQVISTLEKSSGKVCGRFSQNQLSKVLVSENVSSQNRFLKVAGFIVPFLAVNTVQAKSSIAIYEHNQTAERVQYKSFELDNTEYPTKDSLKMISVVVQDLATGELLPFVSIYIDSSKTPIAITDMDGKAKFQVLSSAKIIRVQSLGYLIFEKNILASDFNDNLIVRLNPEKQLIEGDVIFYSPAKPKWWQFRKKKAFKKLFGLEND